MPRKGSELKPSRFRRGMRSIPSRTLNTLTDAVSRTLIGVDAPKQPRPSGKGGGSSVIVVHLVSVEDDHLICEGENSTEVLVAKPYELRVNPWDGNTINGVSYAYTDAVTRVADGTETQHVIPAYVAGAEIYATKPKGGIEIESVTYEWLEINQGRAWAAEDSTA